MYFEQQVFNTIQLRLALKMDFDHSQSIVIASQRNIQIIPKHWANNFPQNPAKSCIVTNTNRQPRRLL